jgi:RNA polymerase sigma-70 factor (ECF subfamily)
MDGNTSTHPAFSECAGFATTQWSVVLAASDPDNPAAADALYRPCRTCWSPLYAYVRRRGGKPTDAEDLTQEFRGAAARRR